MSGERRRHGRDGDDDGQSDEAVDATAVAPTELPLIAVVGRPNVGKSTLFNRLVGGHHAIVEDEPGVTRDRRYGQGEWTGRLFRVVDTGGLDPAAAARSTIAKGVLQQALRAIDEAALVLFVVDAQQGVTSDDREAAERLRRMGKPFLWVANKVDGSRQEGRAVELYELGADEVLEVSAAHGRGIGDLLDRVIERLPHLPRAVTGAGERPIRVALVGRPNAGKSSLVNRLLGDERVIVDATPGTTRDPVDSEVTLEGTRFILIDTAGIRRRARVNLAMEKIAVAMAEKAIERADVTLLVIDAADGVGEQDAKIAGLCEEHGCGLVIAFNKRDLVDAAAERKLRDDLKRQLQFVPWAVVTSCSAQSGRGVRGLLEKARVIHRVAGQRVSTGALNRWLEGLVERHPTSLFRGHPIRLYYITQASTHPPTFVLSVSHPEGVHFSYRRYIINQLRAEFGFEGTPLRVVLREHKGKRRR